jgi:hypothetical protein
MLFPSSLTLLLAILLGGVFAVPASELLPRQQPLLKTQFAQLCRLTSR